MRGVGELDGSVKGCGRACGNEAYFCVFHENPPGFER